VSELDPRRTPEAGHPAEPADPLAQLSQAWQELEAPAANRELEDEDPLTQEAVRWMAEAWSQLEAPAAVATAEGRPRRRLRILRSAARAVAAALLVRALALLFPHGDAPDPLVEGPPTAAGPPPPTVAQPPAQAANRPVLLATAEDRIEVRSGSVRLTLLQSAPVSRETTQ